MVSKAPSKSPPPLVHQSAEKVDDVHDAIEKELIDKVCKWCLRVLTYSCASSALLGYLSGNDPSQLANQTLVSICGFFSVYFSKNTLTPVACTFAVLCVLIVRHAISFQGCSACLVPAIYGFFPCAMGFLYRTPRAVMVSTVGVLLATAFIFTVDLSGQCPSEPIPLDDKGTIIADRFLPLIFLIVGNSAVLTLILRQSQEALLLHAKATQSAYDLANMRRDVLQRVTHELRTPLNGLVGSVELLTELELDDHDMENVLTIKRCLSSILGICDDVLIAAKSGGARKETKFVLASCVDDVADVFAAKAHASGIKLKVEFDGDTTAVVRGMEVKLRQVLLNLVGNSLKFTESGSITIRVNTRQEELKDGDEVLRCSFAVEDTGTGIDSQDADMLFEPFHQAEQGAASRRHKGTGLGLTICKDLVELMGGKIAVEGALGQGSRFYFTLLLKKEPQEPTSAPSTASETEEDATTDEDSASYSESPCQIVICDSEKESRESCQSVVKSIAPRSADLITVESHRALLDRIQLNEATSGDVKVPRKRIAFVENKPDDAAFASTVSRLQGTGWLVFVYCDRADFKTAVERLSDAYAVYRRPFQLVRIGNSLREALSGVHSVGETHSGAGDGVETTDRIVPDLVSAQPGEQGQATTSGAVMAPTMSAKVLSSLAPAAEPSGSASDSHSSTREKRSLGTDSVHFEPGAKVVVVDDTPMNVKVLGRMISRSTSAPIITLYDGQSAIDLVKTSKTDDVLLFLMDWHMPGVCGLNASETIRRIVLERGGPRVYICMVTADIEGLSAEMERRELEYRGTVSKSCPSIKQELDEDTGSSSTETTAYELPVIDIATGKPITFQGIKAILTWFQKNVDKNNRGCPSTDSADLVNTSRSRSRIPEGATMIVSRAHDLTVAS